jgi:hypothetical protein
MFCDIFDKEETLMRVVCSILAALLSFPATAADRNRFSVIGEWEWNPVKGDCPERYSYRTDGLVMMQSADERLVKTYVISKASNEMYRISSAVKATNGKPDCRGELSPVGSRSSVFVMPAKGGGFMTCSSLDPATCFGTAKAAKRKR